MDGVYNRVCLLRACETPGRANAGECHSGMARRARPETHEHRLWQALIGPCSWVPGSRTRPRPGMARVTGTHYRLLGAPMSSLQAARQDWSTEVRSCAVRASMNYALGVYSAGALVDAPADRSVRVISFERLRRYAAAKNGRARSHARSDSANNSGKQRAITARCSGQDRGFLRQREIFPLLFSGRTAGTAKQEERAGPGKVNACSFSVKAGAARR